MSIIPDDLKPGDHVRITIAGEANHVDREDDSIHLGDDWIYPNDLARGGAKVTVEKVEKPFTPPARGAFFTFSQDQSVCVSLGADGYSVIRNSNGDLTDDVVTEVWGKWETCIPHWRDGITVIVEATP